MQYSIGFRDIPFRPNKQQIIYVESHYDSAINEFIRTNYDAICDYCDKRALKFCYLPYLSKELNSPNLLQYYAPYATSQTNYELSSDWLLEYMTCPENRKKISPSLLYYKYMDTSGYPEGTTILCGITIECASLWDTITEIHNEVYDNDIRYSISADHAMEDFVKAEYPDKETWQLIHEIEERVEQLAQKGISEHILAQIVAKPQVVSRMVITTDNRIILPDYGNMEIEMTPLVKAVYFLFLRHPEGIVYKCLTDYRNELADLYSQIKSGQNIHSLSLYEHTKIMCSVNDIADPTKNSINEKVARIREAFVTRFNERLAINYIVQGGRGEPKRIPLHREMVEWQTQY